MALRTSSASFPTSANAFQPAFSGGTQWDAVVAVVPY